MNLLNEVLPLKTMIKFNILVFLIVLIPTWIVWEHTIPLKSFIAGYFFCSLNLWALCYLGGLLVQSAALNGKAVKHIKGVTVILGVVKFVLFIAALFVMIAILRYSAIHIFFGSFVALTVTAAWMSFTYLNYIKKLRMKREEEHAVLVQGRMTNQVTSGLS